MNYLNLAAVETIQQANSRLLEDTKPTITDLMRHIMRFKVERLRYNKVEWIYLPLIAIDEALYALLSEVRFSQRQLHLKLSPHS